MSAPRFGIHRDASFVTQVIPVGHRDTPCDKRSVPARKSYIRENVIPVFISERTPAKNREDLWTLLKECDMQYLNQLEWLIRTHTQYSGDKLFVKRPEDSIGIAKSAKNGNYKGRTKIKIDKLAAQEIFLDYQAKKINSTEAARMLGISNSTFLRRYREYVITRQ